MRTLFLTVIPLFFCAAPTVQAQAPFAIHVVDDVTGRGVPLVELKNTPDQIYMTDSQGYIAIDDPVLLGRRVYFDVFSHGYEYPKDGFGRSGVTLQVKPGGEATVKIKRLNVAERLYRITGAGIYRDSVKLKKPTPIKQPLLNGEVTGQDTVQTVVRGNQIYWFWGDTDRLSNHLGQFNTSGAVSRLPGKGGLDPDKGVNLEYFVGDDGFSRPMFPRENGTLIWVGGAFDAPGPDGKPKVLTHFSRRKDLGTELSSGLAMLNDQTNVFETVREYEKGEVHPDGQSFKVQENGVDYIYFADPYPQRRVRADWKDIIDSAQWEVFTPLKPGTDRRNPELDRNSDGTLNWAWKKNTPLLDYRRSEQLIRSGAMKQDENWRRTVDAATGDVLLFRAGSVKWNNHRQRWVMIAHQTFGKPSFLGEVWYAEAKKPEGPFQKAVRIVTHDKYSFYNVTQHDFFDQDGGRQIYFEGTYTILFTQNVPPTPWYDYNQIMYRLDLADPRLQPAFVD